MSSKTRKLEISDSHTSSEIRVPHFVATDLLPDLLLRLPLKPLYRFTLVCKRWHALITKDSRFQRLLISNQKPKANGMLISWYDDDDDALMFDNFPYFSIDNDSIPLRKLDLGHDEGLIMTAAQSCNGLLLYYGFLPGNFPYSSYYVCNMTTKKSKLLPDPNGKCKVILSCLAFDPAVSPCYKVVSIVALSSKVYQIYIYSSDTGHWRVSGEPFPGYMDYCRGVYWNGAVHWINPWIIPWNLYPSYYFNVEKEMLLTMPSVPTIKNIWEKETENPYIGESHGHLYYTPSGFEKFDIYEMKRDYSEWFIKHTVFLAESPMGSLDYTAMKILSVICGEEEGDSFLIFRDSKRVMRFGLVSNTCQKIHDIEDTVYMREFQYIESICSV